MRKILLCIEDHKILNNLSLVFKKLGFDIESLNSETGLQEKLLGFKADAVVTCGSGQKVSPIGVSKKLNDWGIFKRGVKYIVVLNNQYKISPADLARTRIDGFLEVHFPVERTIEVLCKTLNIESKPMVEKLHRMVHSGQLDLLGDKINAESHVKNMANVIDIKTNENINAINEMITIPSVDSDHDRVQKYLKYTQDLPKKTIDSLPRSEARKMLKEMSKNWDKEDLEFLDAEKREFVRALFRKPG
jgi:hypothetical protein